MEDPGEHLIIWVKQHFGVGPFDGATGINEQGPEVGHHLCCSSAGLGSDTSRWAAMNALYYAKTGDTQAKENAIQSLNYATYFADSDGRYRVADRVSGAFQYWFSDGYSDYLRSFNWSMAAIPIAPGGQDHLLGSTSVVQIVTYGHDRITYRTFDADAIDVLRLAFRPLTVTAGGQTLIERDDLSRQGYTIQQLSGVDFVLKIHHVHSGDVQVAVNAAATATADEGSTILPILLLTGLVLVGLILLLVYRGPVRSRVRSLPRLARGRPDSGGRLRLAHEPAPVARVTSGGVPAPYHLIHV